MQLRKSSDILLESGTNEISIMVFTIGGNYFGINVAKVREIMMIDTIKPMPQSHPAVEGVFKPRDILLTVINLPKYLDVTEMPTDDRGLFIITNFNKMHMAFRVHTVFDIITISWEAIQKPDKTIYGGTDGIATGIAQCDDKLVTILDFEKIIAEISPETSIQISEIDKMGVRNVDDRPILIAEDSVLLSKMIIECLHKAGYSNIIKCDDGQQAWEHLNKIKNAKDIRKEVAIVITDIEMPKMDGHRLTKLVKDDPKLKTIPLVIFSSLINPEMHIKGKQLGADEQLSKPEIGHLVDVIDHLIGRA